MTVTGSIGIDSGGRRHRRKQPPCRRAADIRGANAALYMGAEFYNPLTASPTVTAKALDNAGTLEITGGVTGAPSIVTVNGPVQNTGDISLLRAGPVRNSAVRGLPASGKAFSASPPALQQLHPSRRIDQGDDSLLKGTRRSAFSGGALTGLGTVAGELLIAGGSVEALGYGLAGSSLGTTPGPGALSVTGSYQPKAGKLGHAISRSAFRRRAVGGRRTRRDRQRQWCRAARCRPASMSRCRASPCGESFVVLTETARRHYRPVRQFAGRRRRWRRRLCRSRRRLDARRGL